MSEEPKDSRQFWTFVVKGIHLEGARAFASGWFILCEFSRPGKNDFITTGVGLNCNVTYITPESAPVTFEVTALIAPETKLDDLSPKLIVKGLRKIFSLPYEEVPDVPVNVPEHRIPPSKRDKIRAALRSKQTAGTMGGSPWRP